MVGILLGQLSKLTSLIDEDVERQKKVAVILDQIKEEWRNEPKA